jgi:hypothetical protein
LFRFGSHETELQNVNAQFNGNDRKFSESVIRQSQVFAEQVRENSPNLSESERGLLVC